MTTVKLVSLKAKNFRSFKDLFYEFKSEQDLFLLNGHNTLTGDGSGTGKSSFFLAIAYCLDILPTGFSATEQRNWFDDEPMQVELTLDIDGELVVLGRGSSTFIKRGDTKITGAKAVNDALPGILGCDINMFQAMVFRPQKTQGFFIHKTDSQKKEFLSSVLGLNDIENLIQKLELEIKEQELQYASETSVLEKWKESIKDPITSIPDKTALLEQFKTLEKQKTDFKMPYPKDDPNIQLAEQFLQKMQREITVMERSYGEARLAIQLHDSRMEKLKSYAETEKKLNKELELLKLNTCPTCKQVWNSQESKILHIEDELSKYATAKAQLTELGLAKPADPEAQRVAIAEKQAQLNIFKGKLSETMEFQKQEFQKELKVLSDQFAKIDIEFNTVQKQIFEIEATERLLVKQQQTQDLIAKHGLTLQDKKTKINLNKDIVAALGRTGFMGLIFEEILNEISVEANQLLGRMANVSSVTIQISSEKVDKSGGIKNTINTAIYNNGVSISAKSGLSGGMLTSVEQAVDFGLMKVLERRSGVVPKFLLLDEIFDGQGTLTKESAMEILKELSQDKIVLVIDHDSQLKEFFNQTIDIEYNGKYSAITN
jgi:DNA repair exonuclease SbcCD ATPase subunit